MHRSFLFFGVAFIALMAGALFYAARLPVGSTHAPAAVRPSFSLPDLDGATRTLDDWAGRDRLLNFWATWCAPCRREIPLLTAFQARQGEDGLQIIGIAVDEPDAVKAYAETAKINYPVVVGQDAAMAVAESSGIDFVGLPFTMIVTADGELLSAHIGEVDEGDLEHIGKVLSRLDRGDIDKSAARDALDIL